MRTLTLVEIANVDLLRLRLVELGHPVHDVPAEAIVAAAIKLQELAKNEPVELVDLTSFFSRN